MIRNETETKPKTIQKLFELLKENLLENTMKLQVVCFVFIPSKKKHFLTNLQERTTKTDENFLSAQI